MSETTKPTLIVVKEEVEKPPEQPFDWAQFHKNKLALQTRADNARKQDNQNIARTLRPNRKK